MLTITDLDARRITTALKFAEADGYAVKGYTGPDTNLTPIGTGATSWEGDLELRCADAEGLGLFVGKVTKQFTTIGTRYRLELAIPRSEYKPATLRFISQLI